MQVYNAPAPMMSEKGGLNGAKDFGNTKNVLFTAPHHEVKIVAKKANSHVLSCKILGPFAEIG